MRIVYRQIQNIPFEMWMKELELEHITDEEEARLGHPMPKRTAITAAGKIPRPACMKESMRILNNLEGCLRNGRRIRPDKSWKLSATIITTGKEKNCI